jgi:RNA polymerase sigma-70 factor, ECF subfamily
MGDDYAQCFDDAEILKKVTENPNDYFHLLPAKYGKTVFAVALRMLGNPHDAEEVAADAFVQAYRSLPNLIEKGQAIHFRLWLVVVVRNLCRNFKRRYRPPDVPLTDDVLNWIEGTSCGQDLSAEDEAIRHETNEALYRLLRRLPQRQHDIVILYYIGGLADPEIARILERKPDTIKKDRELALKKLREMRNKAVSPIAEAAYDKYF